MMTPAEWTDKYRGTKAYFLVYSALIDAARTRGTITYQDIAELMDLPTHGSHMGRETGLMLGTISYDEHHYGRPLLSAIAVNTHGEAGEGFYALARELGRLNSEHPEEQRRFWEAEAQAVYDEWKKTYK